MTSEPRAAAADPSARVPRILIDCTGAYGRGPTTGIPRVVVKYARYAQAWGRAHGVPVAWVEAAGFGRFRVIDDLDRPILSDVPRPPLVGRLALEATRLAVRVGQGGLGIASRLIDPRLVARGEVALSGAVQRLRIAVEPPAPGSFVPESGDILFCAGYWPLHHAEAYAEASRRGAQVFFLAHDLIPITHPQMHDIATFAHVSQAHLRAFDHAAGFYAISRATLDALEGFAGAHGRRIAASLAYNGFDAFVSHTHTGALDPALAALLARAPWMMVGTLSPRKGYLGAIAAFTQLWDEGYQRPLVIFGARGWQCDDIRGAIEGSRYFGERLFWSEGASDQVLATFYEGAHAFLCASLMEGFGLPPLEASAHGTACLARDLPVLREVLGDGGAYFADDGAIATEVRALEDPERVAAARAAARAMRWYPWESVVARVMEDMLKPPTERARGDALLAGVARVPICGASLDHAEYTQNV